MKTLNLVRMETGDEGTFGELHLGDNMFYTAELPWRDNKPNISCIPEGVYQATLVDSPSKGRVYQIHDVTGRTHILIHVGNVAGDESKGLKSNVLGCICLGLAKGRVFNQKAVIDSARAMGKFHDLMSEAKARIIISSMRKG